MLLLAASFGISALGDGAPVFIRVILTCTIVSMFGVMVWVAATDTIDRDVVKSLVQKLRLSSV